MEHELNRIIHWNEEVRLSTSYFHENSPRLPRGLMVIQLTISGTGLFLDNNNRFLLGKDQAMVFKYGDSSSYGYPAECNTPYRHRFLAFSGPAVLPAFCSLQERFGPVLEMDPGSSSRRLFMALASAPDSSRIKDRYEESSKLYELVMALLRDQSRREQRTDPAMALYELMHNSFQQPISLKQFAAEHQVSREYLSRKFKNQYGTGPATLLRTIRMKHAHSLIESTTIPISEAGRQCGYPDLNAFSRAYRNMFRESPRDTRK